MSEKKKKRVSHLATQGRARSADSGIGDGGRRWDGEATEPAVGGGGWGWRGRWAGGGEDVRKESGTRQNKGAEIKDERYRVGLSSIGSVVVTLSEIKRCIFLLKVKVYVVLKCTAAANYVSRRARLFLLTRRVTTLSTGVRQ